MLIFERYWFHQKSLTLLELLRGSNCGNGIYQREMITMLTIEGLLIVLGYTFTVFALGYAIGYNHHKKQK